MRCFILPSYQSFKSHHLVGRHKLHGIMKVAWLHITLCSNACNKLRRVGASCIHSHLYCTCALVIYTCHCYVCDTLVYFLHTAQFIWEAMGPLHIICTLYIYSKYISIYSMYLYAAASSTYITSYPHCWPIRITMVNVLWRYMFSVDERLVFDNASCINLNASFSMY